MLMLFARLEHVLMFWKSFSHYFDVWSFFWYYFSSSKAKRFHQWFDACWLHFTALGLCSGSRLKYLNKQVDELLQTVEELTFPVALLWIDICGFDGFDLTSNEFWTWIKLDFAFLLYCPISAKTKLCDQCCITNIGRPTRLNHQLNISM